jgi:hypothetical protein
MIYFIKATWSSQTFYKIGFTSKNPENRLKQLQTSCPVKLELAKVFNGCRKDERRLHDYLDCARVEGEWFKHIPLFDDFLKKADGENVFNNKYPYF